MNKLIMAILAISLVTTIVSASNDVEISQDISIISGETITIPIHILDATCVAGGQMVLHYDPEVIRVVNGSAGAFDWYYAINYDQAAYGRVMILTLMSPGCLSGNLTFGNVEVMAVGMPGNSSILEMRDIILSDDHGYYVPSDLVIDGSVTIRARPGDVNGDGVVAVDDALLVLHFIFHQDISIDEDAADVTGDGNIDIADVLRILNYCVSPGPDPLRS